MRCSSSRRDVWDIPILIKVGKGKVHNEADKRKTAEVRWGGYFECESQVLSELKDTDRANARSLER